MIRLRLHISSGLRASAIGLRESGFGFRHSGFRLWLRVGIGSCKRVHRSFALLRMPAGGEAEQAEAGEPKPGIPAGTKTKGNCLGYNYIGGWEWRCYNRG